jgi:hypothetical protein
MFFEGTVLFGKNGSFSRTIYSSTGTVHASRIIIGNFNLNYS